MVQQTLALRIQTNNFTCDSVRVPKASTISTALRVAGYTGPCDVVRASVLLTELCDAVPVLDEIPLDIQINAAANALSIDLDTLPQPPLLVVVMNMPDMDNAGVAAAADAANVLVIDCDDDDVVAADDANIAEADELNGAAGGGLRQRRRSRVTTENAIAASVARDAANPDNDGELPTVEVSLPPGRGASANRPAPRKVARLASRQQPLNIADAQPNSTAYVVLTLTPPRKMKSLVFTLFCGFAGELQSQRASFVTPKAEPLLRDLFADAAIYLLHVQHVAVVSLRNVAIGNVGGIGLYSNHDLLVKAANAMRVSPLLPGADAPVDGGTHWNACDLRRDLASLANEAHKLTVTTKAEVKSETKNTVPDKMEL